MGQPGHRAGTGAVAELTSDDVTTIKQCRHTSFLRKFGTNAGKAILAFDRLLAHT